MKCRYCGHDKCLHDGAKNLGSCHAYSNGSFCRCARFRTTGESENELIARLSAKEQGKDNK
jgi:hypothetical protein